MRLAFAMLAIIAGLVACGPARVRSDEKADEAAENAISDKLPPATTASLRHLLSERVEIPDRFRAESLPIKTVTEFLVHEALKHNELLPVTVDKLAFKDTAPDAPDVWEIPVEFPKHLRSMTYRQVLRVCTSQTPVAGTFILREGTIVIYPGADYKVESLLKSEIAVEFHDKPLVAAIEEICDRSGLSIAVDPHCDDGNKKTVTLQVDGGMSVRGILESIADVHDLKVLVTPTRVAVLPHAAYMKRLSEQVEAAKLERQLSLELGPTKEELLKKEFDGTSNSR